MNRTEHGEGHNIVQRTATFVMTIMDMLEVKLSQTMIVSIDLTLSLFRQKQACEICYSAVNGGRGGDEGEVGGMVREVQH